MDHAADVLLTAHHMYARANETSSTTSTTSTRPASYKVIGISLAVSSGAFIGTSFVLKKVGLLKANEKYNEVAGEGYGYLKNVYWWSGMTLMIIGEICNFVAYAFTDAILVTPLGALSVVLTTILSAIFLKERLSMVGKVACFLCIVGSVVIVMNAPQESSVADIQQMQHYVITPGFLSFAGVIIVGSIITAFYCGPRWGKKNMLVYLSICSWVGGLSVVATQGLGSAIVAQAGGKSQFNHWFLYVLLIFVIATLLTEIIYLNKALNLFNAAMVTPTYYVYFTSTTIITSAVLFQGFKGTPTSIITVVNGFLTICSGVVLLQLSKSAKDVPDTAVFTGDLNQIQTIAEQEQPESEPKADAIRGTAALVRRFSSARQNMEIAELKRLHEERMRERLDAVSEDGNQQPQYEWDGIRRRRTTLGSHRSRPETATSAPFTPPPPTPHPPLGWTHIPTQEELDEHERVTTPGVLASIAGTIRGRGRSILAPKHREYDDINAEPSKVQSPMHPVQLTEIAVPAQHSTEDSDAYYGGSRSYNLPSGKTEYIGAITRLPSQSYSESDTSSLPPDPPPHLTKRQFSFQNVFRKHTPTPLPEIDDEIIHQERQHRPPVAARAQTAPQVKGSTEEERLGLVKGDSRSAPMLPALPSFKEEDPYDEDEDDDSPSYGDRQAQYGRGITGSPPRRGNDGEEKSGPSVSAYEYDSRGRLVQSGNNSAYGAHDAPPPPPPSFPGGRRYSPPRGGDGTYI